MKAIWNNEIIAESENTIKIKDEIYFPADSVKTELLKKNGKTGICEERGGFCLYNLRGSGVVAEDAAMVFNEPAEAAAQIRNYIVFDKSVVNFEQ